MPKFHLLYFKNLLDVAIINFFNENNDNFKKINNKYVLSKDISKSKLLKIFRELILNQLSNYITKYDRLTPNYYFILGSCLPKNNILLDYKDIKYFPKKLDKIIKSEYNIKYLLKEKDIDMNILRFNDVCIELSNLLFATNLFTKYFGKEYKNIFFIQHNKIDCYILFKILKFIYGRSNCINIFKEKMINEKLPLIAINDMIDRYVNKKEINNSKKIKIITQEIQQYIDEKIKKI